MDTLKIIDALTGGRLKKQFMPQLFIDLLQNNKEVHDNLGELPALKRLEQKNVTRDEYVAVLKKTYGLYATLEPALESSLNWGSIRINFDERRKLPWLERDLAKFGVTDQELAEIPRCETLPDLSTMSRALGCMAVIEGSTAGAQATALKLKRSQLKLTETNGAEFYNNYGDARNQMRKSFGEKALAQNPNRDEFLAGGKETFQLFYDWLAA